LNPFFFAWLLAKDRLPTKRNLHRKTIVPTPTCDLCNSADETALHLCFQCPFAVAFWGTLNMQVNVATLAELASLPTPIRVPSKHFLGILLAMLLEPVEYHHWVVFRHEAPSLRRLLVLCIEDASLWGERLKLEDRHVILSWKDLFS
jgi:hypothetical protein